MGRLHWTLSTVVVLTVLVVVSASAQPPGQRTMGKYGWRWHSPIRHGTNITFDLPVGFGYAPYGYWPYGGYYGYGNLYGVPPAYGNAAYGYTNNAWSPNRALVTEQAREQYLLNVARSNEIRRQQQKAADARKAQRDDERSERRARNLARPAKRPTDLYARLSVQQLDFGTGAVSWPKSLLREEFRDDRAKIESVLSAIAANGPDDQIAAELRAIANQMKKQTNSLVSEMGFTTYTETRRFLNSLSVEGYYALEDL